MDPIQELVLAVQKYCKIHGRYPRVLVGPDIAAAVAKAAGVRHRVFGGDEAVLHLIDRDLPLELAPIDGFAFR